MHRLALSLLVAVLTLAAAGQTATGQRSPDYRIRLETATFDPLERMRAYPSAANAAPQRGGWFLVQFIRTPTEGERKALQQKYRLRLTEYVPHFTYIERLTLATIAELTAEPLYRAHVPYEPQFKVSTRIGQQREKSAARRAMSGFWVIAVLFPDADPQVVANALRAQGREVQIIDERKEGGSLKVTVILPSMAEIRQLAQLPEVRWIEEVPVVNLDNRNTAGRIQAGVAGTTPIWNAGIHGEGQIVGIMDTRLDFNHCAFQDTVDNTVRAAHRKVVGFRETADTTQEFHGTFVGGIVAGDDFNNLGTGMDRGMAWAARLTYDQIDGTAPLGEWAQQRADGATIHTNSWHIDDMSYTQLSVDTDTFLRNNEDAFMTGSSGNTGAGETIGPPGTAKNALNVSASNAAGNFGDGNSGPTTDGRRKPELFAPGCAINSVTVRTMCGFNNLGCATSWATPAVAGAGALIRQYFMEGFYPTGTRQPHHAFVPTGALLKAMLLNGTADMGGIAGYPGNQEGWGLVQLDRVVSLPGAARNVRVWDTPHASGFGSGSAARNHIVNVAAAGQPLRVTLTYTDRPGAAGAANSLVNDLDLTVTSPNGAQVFRGNVFAAGVSTTGGAADNVNNVEMVVINNPAVGNWTVTVTPTNIPSGPQGYALVATADFPDVPATAGNQNTLVVRAKFSDIAPEVPLANVQSKMANVASYVSTISYNQTTILPEYRSVNLDNPTTFYYHPTRNLLIELTTEAVQKLVAADANVFTKGTADPADDIDRVVIVTNDTNFNGDWATTGPWPYDLPGGFTRPLSVSIQSEANDDARFAHGIAHQFGLVDLYAHPGVTFPRAFVDEWDNMATPFRGQQPLVWSKERAQWLTSHLDTISYIPRPAAGASTSNTFTVNAQESTAVNRKAIAVGLTPGRGSLAAEDQFYMIEVRDQTATAESTLPSSGVLIYLVNELVPQGQGPVILRDANGGTGVLEAFTGGAHTIPGTGITVTILSGSGAGPYDIKVDYAAPATDYNLRITRGDTIDGQFFSWFSPDIWVDSPINGASNLAGGPPPSNAPERPVVGVVNQIRVRIFNDTGVPAENFDVRLRISEPYHTVGDQASFDSVVGIQHVDTLNPGDSRILSFPWTPIDTGQAHSCAWAEFLNLTGTDRNANDNAAQENLERVTSVTGSPYHPTDFNFNIENPYDEPALFYFRVNGAPANWSIVKSPAKALLNPGERLEGKITVTPPEDEPLCTSRILEIAAWTPRGDTLIPVGGSVVQVDMRRPTKLTLETEEGKCRGADFETLGVDQRNCRRITASGCTIPPQPNQKIWVRYVSASGEVVWHEVTTDAMGCFDDFIVTGDSSVWTATAGFEGNDCQGPVETTDPSRPGEQGGNPVFPPLSGENLWFSLHLGHNYPAGSFRKEYASGPSITLDFERDFRDRFSLYGMFGYHYFDAKTPGSDETYLTNLSLNLRLYGPAGPWRRFIGFGPGLYRDDGGATDAGANLAIGLEFPVLQKLKLETGVDLHAVNASPRIYFFDVKLGVKFTF